MWVRTFDWVARWNASPSLADSDLQSLASHSLLLSEQKERHGDGRMEVKFNWTKASANSV